MNSKIKTPNRIPLALSTAMLLTCVWAGPSAFADEQVRSETVKFHDLNVDTPEGCRRSTVGFMRPLTASALKAILYCGKLRPHAPGKRRATPSKN